MSYDGPAERSVANTTNEGFQSEVFPLVARELVWSGELAAAVSPGASEGLLPCVRPRVGLQTGMAVQLIFNWLWHKIEEWNVFFAFVSHEMVNLMHLTIDPVKEKYIFSPLNEIILCIFCCSPQNHNWKVFSYHF